MNCAPCFASLSMLGVRDSLLPWQPSDQRLWSSVTMQMMFSFFVGPASRRGTSPAQVAKSRIIAARMRGFMSFQVLVEGRVLLAGRASDGLHCNANRMHSVACC